MTARRLVIVGGGILGCVIASRLVQGDHGWQVTIIDRALVGSGASMYSAGVHFPVGRSGRVRQLSTISAAYYGALHARHPELPIHSFDMWVAAPAMHADEVASRCVGLQTPSVDERLPVPQDVAPGHVLWRLPSCHVCDVQRIAQWHARDLRNRTTVLEGACVMKIAEMAGGVRVFLSTGQAIDADDVVVAPGPWVNEGPFRELTAELGIRTKKVVAMHIQRPLDHGAALYFPVEDAFLAPVPHRGHWLFSYTCPQWDVSPSDSLRASVEAREIDEAHSVVSRVVPGLAPFIAAGRVFCDAYSPDREPIVRRIGRHQQIVFAGAANGAGYRLAPGVALEVVDLLAHTHSRQGA